tara:strand:+ start:645 stop:941 length:297 start_codon:yes stop_codon:yes gene_type:complete
MTDSSTEYKMPSTATMSHAMKIAIVEDKPIMMDYWTSSLEQKSLIGVNEKQEKLLVKSDDEYTSTIAKIYKLGEEFIIMTENSIYIVHNSIQLRKIST